MWRKVSKEAAAEIAKEAAKHIALWAIPPGIGVMGWLQDVPWFYVAVGVILSGAGIMTWLVQLDEWRSRNRVEHKLVIATMRIHLTQAKDGSAIRFGFLVRNTAAFPITFRMESMETSLRILDGNKLVYPPNKPYQKDSFVVSPGGIGWFDDHDIVLPRDFREDTIAEIKADASYGKSERFSHKLSLNKNTHIKFGGDGKISGGATLV